MRAVAYALLWFCIVFPLWLVSLIVQAHFEYVPPLWLGLWAYWGPVAVIIFWEVRLMVRK